MAYSSTCDQPLTRRCEKVIEYAFQNPLLLWEALQAGGSPLCQGPEPRYASGNKRPVIVGDKVLDMLLAFKRYPTWTDREQLDPLRQTVTSNKILQVFGERNKLVPLISLAAGTPSITQRKMSEIVEAIVGAAYHDDEMDAVKTVVVILGIDALEKESAIPASEAEHYDGDC